METRVDSDNSTVFQPLMTTPFKKSPVKVADAQDSVVRTLRRTPAPVTRKQKVVEEDEEDEDLPEPEEVVRQSTRKRTASAIAIDTDDEVVTPTTKRLQLHALPKKEKKVKGTPESASKKAGRK